MRGNVEVHPSIDKESGFASRNVSFLRPVFVAAPMRLFTYGAFKRGFDATVSFCSLVMLLPLFLVVAAAIKFDSPGPVLFKQKRTGKNGKEFNILKFRSMSQDNNMKDLSCDDKCTRVGGWLRKTSIDELPQLINVLRGQMAFIGPRPWIPEYWDNMNEQERRRYSVRPGITGLAAAKGRNGLNVFEKINYDLEYVNNYSLKMDTKVVFLTIKQVLSIKEADAGKKKVHNDIKDLKKENGR